MTPSLTYGRDVLLFYERHSWDYVYTYSHRTISGFEAWYTLLSRALRENGFRVHENNYDLARANPSYPIGLVGTPICIPRWSLPNPAVLGPSMYDNPAQNPELMRDSRFKRYILTCDWLYDIFRETYGEACVAWRAGISTDDWPDTRHHEKFIDVLLYDKIRWGREKVLALFLEPVIEYLDSTRRTYYVARYGDLTHQHYKDLLSKSRAMVFLCEHETQGIAYQEALASNVPVLAWDHGWWTDPVWPAFSRVPLKASSVPHFSTDCGSRFGAISDFPSEFENFWANVESYSPRSFVARELSFEQSARRYAQIYFGIDR